LAAPAITSSFSQFYHQQVVDDFDPEPFTNILNNSEDFMELLRNPQPYYPSQVFDRLVKHYMKSVVNIQYLLADESIPGIIFETVSSHQGSRDAVSLLASVHWSRFQHPDRPALTTGDTQSRFESLAPLLNQPHFTAEDAMAALHVVSSILFDGGKGGWQQWLRVACTFVASVFSQYHDATDALLRSPPKQAFIIKTAIWFDVLASVTTQADPFFLQEIRAMFDPSRSIVHDPSSPFAAQYSMMSPMGCENHVVWALAETSHLSVWKQSQVAKGRLSIPELVARSNAIDIALDPPQVEDLRQDDTNCRRRLASEIFRSSTRLYLRSVVSGDHPHVPEIKESVQDTISSIQRIKHSVHYQSDSTIARSVVRSTVFSLFICGALAEDQQHQSVILEQLDREMGEGVGNCSSIRSLLQQLWDTRAQSRKSDPVQWRDLLDRSRMLLV
jgi:hypothetical protein